MAIGLIGFFGIGLFSEDRSRILEQYGIIIGTQGQSVGLHEVFSVVVFGGLVIAGIFAGILVFIYSSVIFRKPIFKILVALIGLYMIFIPPIPAYQFVMGNAPSAPFWEWMMLFAIMAWLVPTGFLVIKDARRSLKTR